MTDDPDPFSALLAQHSNETTILDQHFSQFQKGEQKKPDLMKLDNSLEDDIPIGLTHRQPSFSSLHGDLLTKGMEKVTDIQPLIDETDNSSNFPAPKPNDYIINDPTLTEQERFVLELQKKNADRWKKMGYNPEEAGIPLFRHHSQAVFSTTVHQERGQKFDPIIVVDNHNDDEDDDAPIGLQFRQPSFSSLQGDLVIKGGKAINELPQIIDEDMEEIKEEADTYDQDDSSPEIISDDPQVQMFKEIQRKNEARWKKMGYTPPEVVRTNFLRSLSQQFFSNSQADPIIVVDKNEPEEEEAPIGLTYRQPSFSSLQGGDLVIKGGKSITELPEIIDEEAEETAPQPLIKDKPKGNKKQKKPASPIENQCQVILGLQKSNEERWKKMGYEPPPEVLEFARSQEKMINEDEDSDEDPVIVLDSSENDDAPIGLTYRQPSFSSLHGDLVIKGGKPADDLLDVIEEAEPVIPMTTNVPIVDENPQVQLVLQLEKKNEERWKEIGYEPPPDLAEFVRTNSQASFKSGLETITQPTNVLPTIPTESIEEDQSKAKETSFKPTSPQKSPRRHEPEPEPLEKATSDIDEESVLFGRLEEIVDLPKDSLAYQILLTGNIVDTDDILMLRSLYRNYRNICADKLWIDETEYLNEIIQVLGKSETPKRKHGFQRDKSGDTIKEMKTRKRENIKRYDESIEEQKQLLQKALDDLDDEYRQQAIELDDLYQSPQMLSKYNKHSRQLLDLYARVKQMLLLNHVEEARQESIKIKALEKKEVAEMNRKLRHAYHAADKRLKEEFAVKRATLIQKFNTRIDGIEMKKKQSQHQYDVRINVIRSEYVEK